ncbi:MAG: hypothetical protein JO025_21235 [Verrucomicrobia bacterium]|nr:hypothetical protein [Verrucomicrobiota bacterium]
MAFLNDYPTLNKFLERYPDLDGLVNDEVTFMQMDIDGSGSDVLCTLRTQYPDLAKYNINDLYYGFRALCGKHKGSNKRSQVWDRGSVILKYGSHLTWAARIDEVAPRIVASVNLARKILSEMRSRLGAVSPEVVVAILEYHFGFEREKDESASLEDVRRRFETLHKSLLSTICIACMVTGKQKKGGVRGYVNWENKEKYKAKADSRKLFSPYKTFGTIMDEEAGKEVEVAWGNIHIDFGVFATETNWTDLAQAGLIIHEASHKFLNTDDYAYCDEGEKYINLSKNLKLKNADSYAYAAISLYAHELIKDDKGKQVRMG